MEGGEGGRGEEERGGVVGGVNRGYVWVMGKEEGKGGEGRGGEEGWRGYRILQTTECIASFALRRTKGDGCWIGLRFGCVQLEEMTIEGVALEETTAFQNKVLDFPAFLKF